jgi:hypothetical protein
VGEDFQVEGGAKVVRVGDKHVFVSSLQESIQTSRANECSVQVSMARRTPLVAWVRGTGGRLSVETE